MARRQFRVGDGVIFDPQTRTANKTIEARVRKVRPLNAGEIAHWREKVPNVELGDEFVEAVADDGLVLRFVSCDRRITRIARCR